MTEPDVSPEQRLERKLEAVRKVLQLEQVRGHTNAVVIGGLDAFLERWVEDPQVRLALAAAQVHIPRYGDMSPESRRNWVQDALARLSGNPSTPTPKSSLLSEEAPPATSPASVLRARAASLRRNAKGAASAQQFDCPLCPYKTNLLDALIVHLTVAHKMTVGEAQKAAKVRSSDGSRQAKAPSKASPLKSPAAVGLASPLPVGPALKAKLARMGIGTYRDLLYAFPRRHLTIVPIAELREGEEQAIVVTVQEAKSSRFGRQGRLQATEAWVSDPSGFIHAVWFRRPYVAKLLKTGARLLLTGRPSLFRGRNQFNVEDHEALEADDDSHLHSLVPIYPLTEGVTQRTMRRYARQAVERTVHLLSDPLPLEVRGRAGLVPLVQAVRQMHLPPSAEARDAARRRLAFDELFLLQLGVLARRREWKEEQNGTPIPTNTALLHRLLASLPFALTGAQHRALDEILEDMASAKPMSRLLQGEVGSGKTVVAAAALLMAIAQGHQGALMAPTEILAEQHFKTVTSLFSQGTRSDEGGPYRGFSGLLPGRPMRVALLVGSSSRGTKEDLRKLVAGDQVDMVIGTHAVIQQEVEFARLGLIVVDEQHRFGVEQRAALRRKGNAPHLLVMTATPIPRTLALTLYGDLDVSIIDELPPGRQTIRTRALDPARRDSAYRFIRQQVQEGRQAFVICPLVEESELLEAKAAVVEYERLSREVFPDLRVGLLHGRMAAREKENTMERFRRGELDVLVSTPVVEVGIDVPNATVMLVEGAERFGLSQLHQYRGRVGRGQHPSYCILLSESASPQAQERLTLMESTQDGFQLAEADLRLRGPGEFFGTRQSGVLELKMARLSDLPLLETVREEAKRLFQDDPLLEQPPHRALREEMARFWEKASEAPLPGSIEA
ncbi:MAG: ATP-dependent DNA helicase RecG [Chloroflexi bacterium]|nr:ATP-dependent DNA helicase RecG [Chloroflexota bacterium]